MRLLFLSTKWPPVGGGPGRTGELIANAAVKEGHMVKVLTQWFPDLPKKEKLIGVEIERIVVPKIFKKTFITDFGYLILTMAKKTALESKNFDVVHIHDVTAGVGAYIASLFSKFNSIFKYGGDLVYEFTSMRRPRNWNPSLGDVASWKFDWLSKLLYKLQFRYLKKFSVVYTITNYSYDLLRKIGISESKLFLVRNGTNMNYFDPRKWDGAELRDSMGIPKNSTMFFCSSRLVSHKGIDVLIRAFQDMSSDSYLIIAGDGQYRDELQKIANGNNRIKFVGNLSEKLPQYYAAADIFVLPSLFDWLPNSLIEAMSMGKVCVATNVGGVPEMIDDGLNGFLCNHGDEKSLRFALLKAMKSNKKAIGYEAIKKVRLNFKNEDMFQGIFKLYNIFQ